MRSTAFFAVLALLAFSAWTAEGQASCPVVSTLPKDRREDRSTLRVASWNVEWLFEPNDSDDIEIPWDSNELATAHRASIAAIMAEVNADIWILSEVEDCTQLGALLEEPVLEGLNYEGFLVQGTDSALGQDVALITRIDPEGDLYRSSARVDVPLDGSGCTSASADDTAVSKHFLVHFNIIGAAPATEPFDLLVIGAHLKSMAGGGPTDTGRSCAQREGQGAIIRQLLVQEGLNNGWEILVAGDLNDFDNDVPAFAAEGETAQVSISQAVAQIKGDDLKNAALEIPLEDRYSAYYGSASSFNPSDVSLIDHILLSPALYDKISSASIRHDHDPTPAGLTSDHWPLIVDIAIDDGYSVSPLAVVVLIGLFACAALGLAVSVKMGYVSQETLDSAMDLLKGDDDSKNGNANNKNKNTESNRK